jgi:hypothetical protein
VAAALSVGRIRFEVLGSRFEVGSGGELGGSPESVGMGSRRASLTGGILEALRFQLRWSSMISWVRVAGRGVLVGSAPRTTVIER